MVWTGTNSTVFPGREKSEQHLRFNLKPVGPERHCHQGFQVGQPETALGIRQIPAGQIAKCRRDIQRLAQRRNERHAQT